MPEGRGSLTLVTGGARSGKSAYAESLVLEQPAPWLYIATSQVLDLEMEERVAVHRARRRDGWITIEEPFDLENALRESAGRPVLIDCLTLWLTNHMLSDHDLVERCSKLVDVLARPFGPWVAVTNEVGMGIVPDNALARRFRDEAGRLNQRVAAVADRVVMMVAGLPLQVK